MTDTERVRSACRVCGDITCGGGCEAAEQRAASDYREGEEFGD